MYVCVCAYILHVTRVEPCVSLPTYPMSANWSLLIPHHFIHVQHASLSTWEGLPDVRQWESLSLSLSLCLSLSLSPPLHRVPLEDHDVHLRQT